MRKGHNKTPAELKGQIEAQQDQPANAGNERTAEGEEVRTPRRGEFFRNLAKAAQPPAES